MAYTQVRIQKVAVLEESVKGFAPAVVGES